ncbi:exo-alpha-sialidase [Rhizobium lentis]|uniref:sialidase family protein n=1 Tax=Rhizobium lentis TaxID=1138194 RepID=UPI001C8399EC|nr:sialidase family protein [Rhizobium lentis]MBX5154759.1 exo-alpha-sialidase [Rhizobium lentis]MBX5174730.1 exo-alpha-sialidase [Rhizobium lentis]
MDMQFRHIEIYRRQGEFAAWPANYGLWSWGEEIVVVFARGKLGAKGELHELDRDYPFVPWQARSLDGGLTWMDEPFCGRVPGGLSLSADEHLNADLKIRPHLSVRDDLGRLDEPIDFLDPETIVMCARTDVEGDAVSWFYVSRDRCLTWQGPYRFTGLHLPISARTDIVPLGREHALFMLSTSKEDGSEGRVFCARTADGGRSFVLQGFVGPEPEGYSIMPASVALSGGAMLTLTRCMGRGGGKGWIEAFTSDDEGKTWTWKGCIVGDTGSNGNPPALGRIEGMLLLVYGYRDPPFGIRMRMSFDDGQTWGAEKVIRGDGGTADLGYPRMVKRGEGSLLAVYYFNDGDREERYVAASIVTPAKDQEGAEDGAASLQSQI